MSKNPSQHKNFQKMHSLAIIPVYREPEKAGVVLKRFEPGFVDEICLVVDNPDEGMATEIRNAVNEVEVPVSIINNPERKGIGHAIRQGYHYALDKGFDLIVVMAGNGKDDPKEIPRITNPILNMGYDYVQGSRFLPGGRRQRNPMLRRIFTRTFPYFWTVLSGVR